MPGIDKLHLEDTLENNPQTKALVSFFEQDTEILKKYIEGMNNYCSKVLDAQSALADATSSLSQHLRSYDSWNFPLDSDPESILRTTLKQFASTLDEVSSWQQACRTQLADGMMYPLTKFIEADLSELITMSEMYHAASNDHDQAVAKFCKISKKKEGEKQTQESNEEVYSSTKRFHQTALHFYASLNALQYKRKIALIEPLLGLVHALKSHYTIGQESLNSTELETFLANISSSVQEVHNELGCETQQSISMIDSVEQQGKHLYYAEPPPDMPYIPPNTRQMQKSSYLYNKTKFAGMMTRWDRLFYYTLGGHLMSMPKGEVAGSAVLELDNRVTTQIMEQEERRNVFQVSNGKKTIILQALNERQMNEWISTIQNISKDSTSSKQLIKQSSKERSKTVPDEKTPPLSSGSPYQTSAESKPAKQNRSQTSPMEHFVMDTPIQFDMISPTEEDRLMKGPNNGPPVRINPFDQNGSTILSESAKDKDSPVWEVFEARFYGSMQVSLDRGEQVVFETMQRIMAARAIHNLFKMCETHLVINHQVLRIVDPSHQAIRAMFPLEDISFWTTHKENNRLLGFITRTQGDNDNPPAFHCYVFEVQKSAEEVCNSLSTAANIALKALMDEKASGGANDLTEEETSSKTETNENVSVDSDPVSNSDDTA